MAELTAKKYRIEEKKSNGDLQPLHPETSASVVEYTNTTSGASATNAQDAIDELFSEKQDTLVSGSNIKTINNNSILGSGDLSITANSLLSYSAGGTDDITALQNAFDHIDKSVGTAVRLEHGSHYMSFGYALSGYSYEHAYGSFLVLGYGLTNPTYVRMNDGTWSSSSLALTSDIPSLSGYATETWVGTYYLPLTGGEITGILRFTANGSQYSGYNVGRYGDMLTLGSASNRIWLYNQGNRAGVLDFSNWIGGQDPTYYFPSYGGTFAMTSDVDTKLDKSKITLSGTTLTIDLD